MKAAGMDEWKVGRTTYIHPSIPKDTMKITDYEWRLLGTYETHKLLLLTLMFFVALANTAYGEDWICGTPELIKYANNNSQNLAQGNIVMAAPEINAGDRKQFYTHIPEGRIRATCRKVGKHAYIYVDDSVAEVLKDAELNDIATEFDNIIYPQCHDWFGTEWKPGVDGYSRIFILFHDVGANSSAKGYGGYFSPVDEQATALQSNRKEILYMDAYLLSQRGRFTFLATLAHEFTHLLNWFQNGGSTDESWLEEGRASFAEWAIYGNIHTLFVEGYLSDPSISLPSASSSNTRYGAAFMLLVYIYENYGGKQTIREISAQNKKGIAAINAALEKLGYRQRFDDVFNTWAVANYLNDTNRNPLYGYNNHNLAKYRVASNALIKETNYPVQGSGELPDWGVNYIIFENLPERLFIGFDGDNNGFFNAQILQIGEVEASIIDLDGDNNGVFLKDNLRHDDRLVLMFSSSLGGNFRYEARVDRAPNIKVGDIREEIIWPDEPQSRLRPVGNLISKRTPGQNAPHVGNVHLSSNYASVFIREPYAYVASEWGLEIFDISAPGLPEKVGEIFTDGSAENVFVQQDYAYVSDGEKGLKIIDVKEADSPKLVASYKNALKYLHKTQIIGNHAYLADLEVGLQILDVSDVQGPRLVGVYQPEGKTYAMCASGRYVYLATGGEQGFVIVDVGDPKNPALVGGTEDAGYDIDIEDGYAYMSNGDLAILDVRSPQQPRLVATVLTPGLAASVKVQDGYTYVADMQGGISIVDVHNPQQPQLVSRHITSDKAMNLALSGDMLYVADGHGGLQSIEAKNPTQPQWVNQYDVSGFAHAVYVSDSSAYIADGAGGLKVVETAIPTESFIKDSHSVEGSAYDVWVQEDHAYVATGEGGLAIIDISDSPRTVQHIKTADLAWGIAISGHYAYVCAGELLIADISKPAQARIVARIDTPGYAYRAKVAGNYAYVAALEGGLQILDVANPHNPITVGSYNPDGVVKAVDVFENHVYIAESRSGLQILDINNPQKPELAGIYITEPDTVDVQIKYGYAYLLGRKSLEVLNIGNPIDPELVEEFDHLDWAGGLFVRGNYIYVADGFELRIFRFDALPQAVEDSWPDYSSDIETPTSSYWRYELGQNYPNPFNPETWIPYQLAAAGEVNLRIYNVKGELISTLPVGYRRAGTYLSRKKAARWDGRNDAGERVASGIYFYEMKTTGFRAVKRLVMLR